MNISDSQLDEFTIEADSYTQKQKVNYYKQKMLDLNNKQKMLQTRMKELDAKEKRLSSKCTVEDLFQEEDLK